MKRHPRKDKMHAGFGGNAPIDNISMETRAQRPRVGRYIRLRENGSYIGDWVREQVAGKVGVITDIHPHGWDVVARFKGTDRIGGVFAFDNGQVEVVKTIKPRKETRVERKARWAREDREWEDYLWDDLMSHVSERFDSRMMDPYSACY